jgi:hypothetical protein
MKAMEEERMYYVKPLKGYTQVYIYLSVFNIILEFRCSLSSHKHILREYESMRRYKPRLHVGAHATCISGVAM